MLQLGYCDWWLLGQIIGNGGIGNRGIEPDKAPE
jgi:hypothetical protein